MVTESNVQLFIGESILLKAFVNNRDENITYDWSGPDLDLLSCIHCSEPSFTGLNSTSYTVTATDEEGCHATQNVVINVNNNADVFVPNAFSPNGDGINDRLHVFAKSDIISSIDNFNIYDRWGNQVFNTSEMQINDYSQGWNGLYKGDILDVGIFVWNLQITFIDGTSKHYSGDVTLIK